MDIYSSKFAIMVIILLIGILTLQFMNNDNTSTLIDSETCRSALGASIATFSKEYYSSDRVAKEYAASLSDI